MNPLTDRSVSITPSGDGLETDGADSDVLDAPALDAPALEAPGEAPAETFAPRQARRRCPLWIRVVLATALLFAAAVWVLGEQGPSRGPVLLTITRQHGIDLRDLLAAPLVVAAAVLLAPGA